MKKITTTFLCAFFYVYSYGQDFKIIKKSDNTITTDVLESGPSGFRIGITSNGGGVINEVNLPGIGDIMKNASDRYGRAGQLAVRDGSHGGRYNPTQAGFHEELGTKCKVRATKGKLVVEPRGVSLWHGDGKYDFTRWENVGADPYKNDKGNSDVDGLNEERLKGKQEAEVFSEFDYYGVYEDFYGKNGINTATIRHYYELSFIRKPGHCINQFRKGTSIFNEKALRRDISKLAPTGLHKGTDKDMNGLLAVWSLRNDVNRWDFKHLYYRKNNGTWNRMDSDNNIPTDSDNTVFILAESKDEKKGRALCLYRPNSEINNFPIVGINEKNGLIQYKDDRIVLNNDGNKINYSKFRTKAMSKYGFVSRLSGMINRTRLPDNIYEAYRSEFYILYGTPEKIMKELKKIDGIKLEQTITFAKLDVMKLNAADFSPNVRSDSRLPIKLVSTNTKVATIKNGKISIKAAGKTTIVASQEGNDSYNKAMSISQELVVRDNRSLSTTNFESKENDFTFYPNPNDSSILHLSKLTDWSLYSIQGQFIKEGKEQSIDLHDFTPGVYLLKTDYGIGRLLVK